MARLHDISPESTEGYVRRVLDGQAKQYGGPLLNHLLYARRPALFKAVRGMWQSLDKDGDLGEILVALVNRRVASLNGCVF